MAGVAIRYNRRAPLFCKIRGFIRTKFSRKKDRFIMQCGVCWDVTEELTFQFLVVH